ncbi:MAG: LacI family DNA-binding transcriptional regulator [Alicyclobacillaceae bacterium]|nr:LacI family DNA-binding transcriptional regulator [Alicyclobacillaceae bacterium]
MTMKDVARRAGFSVATVSAVVNNVPIVSPEAKRKILKAIEELQYRPNHIARSLKGSKTRSIAVLVRDITNPFYPGMVFGLEDYCWKHHYQVILANTENDPQRENMHIDELISRRVDAVVIGTALTNRNPYYDKLREHGIPYLFINRRPPQLHPNEYYVGANNKLAGEIAVRHLYVRGYRSIAFITGPAEYSTSLERYDGFISGMRKLRLPVEDSWVLKGDNTMDAGYDLTLRLIRSGQRPEALFCSNDLMAFGAYLALAEIGLEVPRDIALMGIDNNPNGLLIGLTSVDIRNYDMGRAAGELIVRWLEKGQGPDKTVSRLRPRLVERRSVRANAGTEPEICEWSGVGQVPIVKRSQTV